MNDVNDHGTNGIAAMMTLTNGNAAVIIDNWRRDHEFVIIASCNCKTGIDGKVLAWIKEWLHERKQQICIDGHKSTWKEVTGGVP